jgi:beta-mannosidase
MYNDTWPATRSWTTVDHRLRRTPSFHPVRRAFAPVIVVVAREGDAVKVFGVNETRERVRAELHYGLMALAGRYPVDESRPVALEPNASTLLAAFDAKPWDRLGHSTHIAFARLTGAAGIEIARDRLILPFFKAMRWPRARVAVDMIRGKAVLTSRTFAWRVCLDLDGERPYPDNFFDVWPGVPTVLPWRASLGRPRILRLGNR